jgi:hypothetical protein
VRSVNSTAAHLQKVRLINNLHAELLRLIQFGTGLFSSQNEIRFLAHAAAHFAAERLNLCRGFLARQRRRRAGEDKCFTGKNPKLGA